MKTKKVMYEYKILTIIDKLQERIKLIVFKTGTLPRELFFSKYIFKIHFLEQINYS